jgi:hypothetical protein
MRRKILRIDPSWLKARHHEDDFSRGSDEWSLFKSYGPVTTYRRRRVAGAERLPHPEKRGKWVLHVRRPDEKAGDGAVWNFPTGRSGNVSLRILLRKGFGGGLINLTDHFIYPDDTNRAKVVFSLPIARNGSIGNGGKLVHERWYTLKLKWKVELQQPRAGWPGECRITVDGREVAVLPQLNRARSGLSYVRLHSTAERVDSAGMLIERVTADVVP